MALKEVTPDRRVVVRFDVSEEYMLEPPFGMERKASQMCRGSSSVRNKVIYVPSLGWELEPHQLNITNLHEKSLADSRMLLSTLGTATTPLGMSEHPMWRRPDDLPNATIGIDPSVSASGDIFTSKAVEGGDNWDDSKYKLTADQTAYPSSDASPDNLAMDRVMVGRENHKPDEAFSVRFHASSTPLASPSALISPMFVGPAGCTAIDKGNGQYCVKFFGDGQAELSERALNYATGLEGWVIRQKFRYCEAHRTMGAAHRIYIKPIPYKRPENGLAGSILFICEAGDQATSSVGILSARYVNQPADPNVFRYLVPFKAHDLLQAPPPTVVAPHRVDVRRDHVIPFQISRQTFETAGDLTDDSFAFEFYPTVGQPIRIEWFARVPSGCSVNMKLYPADSTTELTRLTTGDLVNGAGEVIGGYSTYTPVWGQNTYYARAFLTGPGNNTPTLYRYRVIRNGKTEVVAPGEIQGGTLQGLSQSGAGSDPSTETGSLEISDLRSELAAEILNRGSVPIQVDNYGVDPDDPTIKSVLFRGFANRLTSTRRGSNLPAGLGDSTALLYPANDWRKADLTLFGEWQRIQEGLAPYLWNFAQDPNNPSSQPYLVTDAIRIMLNWCGFADAQLDIPADSTRLFPVSSDEYLVECLANVGDLLLHFTRDYLGKYLVFCPNSVESSSISVADSGRGMWRLRPQPVPPYNNLAAFQTTGPDSGKLVAFLGSYPDTVVSGQTVKHSFINKGSLHTYTRPPEGNLICVSSTGGDLFNVQGPSPNQLTQTAPNYRSYNFAGLASTDPLYPTRSDPDYLGRIVRICVLEMGAQTPEAVNWILRRVFDRAAHGARCAVFEAPCLFVTDHTDALQVSPRPLRFYDPVTIDGSQWLIRAVHPGWRKDGKQMAIYEAEAPNGVMA